MSYENPNPAPSDDTRGGVGRAEEEEEAVGDTGGAVFGAVGGEGTATPTPTPEGALKSSSSTTSILCHSPPKKWTRWGRWPIVTQVSHVTASDVQLNS